MRLIARYQADDGREFATEAECRAHENRADHMRLVGLNAEQVAAATAGIDARLAEAIENVGAEIRKTRLATGGSKRKRRDDAPLLIEHARAAE